MVCIFCSIDEKRNDFVILNETDKIWVLLDKFSVSKGHTLIVSKLHFRNITELSEDIWLDVLSSLKIVVSELTNKFNPKGFNFISNMNEIAYQSVFHFHLHVIPKYERENGFIWTVKKNLDN